MKFLPVVLLALFGIVLESTLYAQTETPSTLEILKRVLSLEGKWEGKAIMQTGGKTYHFQYFMHFRKMADGNGLYMDEHATIPDVGKLFGGTLSALTPSSRNFTGFQ